MLSFMDNTELDHLNMLSSNEFGVACLNTRTGLTFNIHKTDAFVMVDSQGLPIIEDTPMFNTSAKMKNNLGVLITTDVKQGDTLTISTKSYLVREVRRNGIGGIDVYLKD